MIKQKYLLEQLTNKNRDNDLAKNRCQQLKYSLKLSLNQFKQVHV